MHAHQYQRVKEIFQAAQALDAASRQSFLADTCAGETDLKAEVEHLLRADASSGRFLETPVIDAKQALDRAAAGSEILPEQIGRYRIVRLLGEGGMGSVYEAEQDSPRRRVALKVLRAGAMQPRMLQRFQREVEVLGRLQHPGIARIYDAGVAEVARGDGRTARVPYFAMELIKGSSITTFAHERGLSIRNRLILLAEVCDAVHYGHQHGIVHRDLKPGNVLVGHSIVEEVRQSEPKNTPSSMPSPKIIDFGVARVTNADLALTTLATDAGQIIGTLAYMSPEQVQGNPEGIDARSDIYALGVIGYELLTDRMPYAIADKIAPEAARIIRDEEPSRMSSISRVFRGDIETIFAKALEKEPARRYDSAAALAADIRRYLSDEPIIARPPTLGYQLGKFARRHKEFVAGLVLVFIVLVAGLVVSIRELLRAEAAERNALEQMRIAVARQRESDAASAFMKRVLTFAGPWSEGGGREIKLADMLDAVAADIESIMKDQSELELQARMIFGDSYLNLGLQSEAEKQYRLALALVPQSEDHPSLAALRIMDRITWTTIERRIFFEPVKPEFEFALAEARSKAPPDDPTLLNLLFAAGWVSAHLEELDDARAHLEELRLRLGDGAAAAVLDDLTFSTSDVLGLLCRVKCHQQQWEQSHADLQQALAMEEGGAPFRVLFGRAGLALPGILEESDMDAATDARYRQILEAQERALGPSHPQSVTTKLAYGAFLHRVGRLQEALNSRETVLPLCEPGHHHTALMLGQIGTLQARLGDDSKAADSFARAIEVCRQPDNRSELLSQAWWREGVIRLGMGLHKPWRSEAIRTHCCRLIDDALRAVPTTQFKLDEVDWTSFQFELQHWRADQADLEPRLTTVACGSLEDLRAISEPDPGAYRLTMRVGRVGHPAIDESAWMLIAPWQLDLYRAWNYTTQNPDRWREMLSQEPRERRNESSLALSNWWEAGFGPRSWDTYFAIVGKTRIDLPPGDYRVVVWADDGIRLWIDGQPLIEAWVDRAWGYALKYEATTTLSAGSHDIRVEYNQIVGDARLWVRLEPLSSPDS